MLTHPNCTSCTPPSPPLKSPPPHKQHSLIDKKNARRYDDSISYTMVASKKALRQAGLEKEANPEAHEKLDKSRVGILVGTGMGGLTVFQDNVAKLVQQGYKKITPFFIPYSITNMYDAGFVCEVVYLLGGK